MSIAVIEDGLGGKLQIPHSVRLPQNTASETRGIEKPTLFHLLFSILSCDWLPVNTKEGGRPVCAMLVAVSNLVPIILLVALFGCGKSIEKQIRDQVRTLDRASLGKEQVKVKNIRQMGNVAVAEVEVTTGVKLEKQKGKWVIEEIRIGDRRWEKVDHILELIEKKRIESSAQQMNLITAGIQRFAAARGQAPQATSFRALTDLLSPEFLHPIMRIDAWFNPYIYEATGEHEYDFRSLGPDGRLRTPDDLIASVR